MGFRVQGFGFRVSNFTVFSLGFGASDSGFRFRVGFWVQGFNFSGFRVQRRGCRVQGSGFRVFRV